VFGGGEERLGGGGERGMGGGEVEGPLGREGQGGAGRPLYQRWGRQAPPAASHGCHNTGLPSATAAAASVVATVGGYRARRVDADTTVP
jgi:hypothetical protein